MYEITRPMFWDPTSKLHAENEVTVYHGAGIRKRQWLFVGTYDTREVETWHVNNFSIWSYSTQIIVLSILWRYGKSISLTDTYEAMYVP